MTLPGYLYEFSDGEDIYRKPVETIDDAVWLAYADTNGGINQPLGVVDDSGLLVMDHETLTDLIQRITVTRDIEHLSRQIISRLLDSVLRVDTDPALREHCTSVVSEMIQGYIGVSSPHGTLSASR